jgi:hypothetical protein
MLGDLSALAVPTPLTAQTQTKLDCVAVANRLYRLSVRLIVLSIDMDPCLSTAKLSCIKFVLSSISLLIIVKLILTGNLECLARWTLNFALKNSVNTNSFF